MTTSRSPKDWLSDLRPLFFLVPCRSIPKSSKQKSCLFLPKAGFLLDLKVGNGGMIFFLDLVLQRFQRRPCGLTKNIFGFFTFFRLGVPMWTKRILDCVFLLISNMLPRKNLGGLP